MATRRRSDDVFLVRVWREPNDERVPGWRGSAYHTPSGRRFYFTDLEALRDFLAAELGAPGAPSATEQRD